MISKATPANKMGNNSGSTVAIQHSRESREPIAANPHYRSDAWMATCRPPGCLDRFTEEIVLFQPNMQPCCPEGDHCKQMADSEHTARFQHPLEEEFDDQTERLTTALASLQDIGFEDRERCTRALTLCGGDWRAAVKVLLAREREEAEPWSCATCTLSNIPSHLACNACGAARALPEDSIQASLEMPQMSWRGGEQRPGGCFRGARACTPISNWSPAFGKLPQIPSNCRVLVHVHGFSQPYAGAHRVIEQLTSGADLLHCTVVSFLWPAHTYVSHTPCGLRTPT